jgi:hypothetical protein
MKYLDKRDNADIIEHIRRRYFLKGSACVFLALIVLVFFYLYAYAYFADRLGTVNGVMACILGMAAPFFLLKLHKDVFDRSWEGTITGLKTHLVAKVTAGRVRVPTIHEYIILTVRTENDIITVDRPAAELSRFGVGDRLRHIKGTKYLQACRKNSSRRDCVMCGALVRESGSECPQCHMSLVKFTSEITPKTEVSNS